MDFNCPPRWHPGLPMSKCNCNCNYSPLLSVGLQLQLQLHFRFGALFRGFTVEVSSMELQDFLVVAEHPIINRFKQRLVNGLPPRLDLLFHFSTCGSAFLGHPARGVSEELHITIFSSSTRSRRFEDLVVGRFSIVNWTLSTIWIFFISLSFGFGRWGARTKPACRFHEVVHCGVGTVW